MSLSKEQLRRGHQEGAGLWKTIGKWLKSGNKWLKKSKVISKAGPVVGKLVGTVYPGAGKVISSASKFAKQHGYGPARKCKSISSAQVEEPRPYRRLHGIALTEEVAPAPLDVAGTRSPVHRGTGI